MSRRFITGILSATMLITAISVAAPVGASGLAALGRFFDTAAGLFAIGDIIDESDEAAADISRSAAAPAPSWRDTVNPHRRTGPYWAPEGPVWDGSRG
ncbi:hypothetical protein [Citreimonas sp.]|uniref:hypothetical protein n=1 Tax=Citreimonas sp. TaxID=3036715 RepID=UPI004057FA62